MAGSLAASFQWKLNSTLPQDIEILLDVKGQMVSLKSKLNEVEYYVDDFIAQVYGRNQQDQKEMIAEFRRKLENINSGIMNIMLGRHLKMFRPINGGGVRVPEGISRLKSLQTLEGIYTGGSISKELDDYASDLYASIMKMTGLLTFSNFKSSFWFADSLFPSESFSPPSLLQTLKLEGRLIESPAWLGSMENLTKLPMVSSHLSEN
ncbi:hypothetical protein AAG906_023036 [Vitis piasezkii]